MGLVSAIKKSKCFLSNTEKDALFFIKQQEKVCQKTYPYIKKPCIEFPTKCTQKWENIFSHNKFNWPLIFSLAFTSTSYTKLQNFQFKFLPRIVYTNIQLFKFKYIDSAKCTFCHATEETILLLFCECKKTKAFWNELCSWLSREVKIKILSLNPFDICFGYNIPNPDLLINNLILIAKYHIYSCKIRGQIPALSSSRHLINTIRCTEKNNCI